ncbi:hypothetical protein [Blastococcus sp. TF02A-26]|uniref:hypothetical protein n=1 Tax=Blastococcus sp. TF02A-26 TaxID=2250577 RepID=UPI000DE982BE|nr:hypothetical protein [Blastococcus sp. TF02A-26]RBY83167.1 hypothetical protein DQ240_17330 [Blastococcus sp. TF02A-26]
MTWGVVEDVRGLPIEVYDAAHRELLRRSGGTVEGLLVHVARRTDDGVQVIEVWRSQEDHERAGREIVGPVLAGVLAGASPPRAVVTPFEVRGLVLPAAGVTI